MIWSISREQKGSNPKTPLLLRRLPTSRAITRTRFEVKTSKVNVTRPINAEVCHLKTSNFVGGWSMRYQLPWPAIKALRSWVIARGRGYIVSATPVTATQLVYYRLAVSFYASLSIDKHGSRILDFSFNVRKKSSSSDLGCQTVTPQDSQGNI